MLKNFKITTRLIVTLAVLISLIVGLSALALWQMRTMQTSTREITSNWLPSVELVNAMNTNTSDFRIGEYTHVVNTDEAEMVRVEKEIAAVKAEFEKNRAAYVKLISSDEERKLYESFATDWSAYLGIHGRMIEASRKNENERARTMLEKEGKPLYDKASATLLKMVLLNHDGSVAESKTAEAAYATAQNSLLAGVFGALTIALLAGIWLVRSIAGPLAQAVAVADRVAAGDFTNTIKVEGDDEAARVLKALDQMQSNLSRVVATVRTNSESVATASAQIAQGNLDLSQRTEDQASSLEETAASMEELTSTVQQNSANVRQANELATSAAEIAMRGGDVVQQVVVTMDAISDSSRKVADIISVIDGIAFQTNILALNAAVEAARAGEHGRGFAVVASEVRSLAQRSATAAKEIQALIGDSVDKVAQGGKLVTDAGATMAEVVSSIRRVNDLMGEISAAGHEQSQGIGQVNEAIAQMDQVTQQNAALVEEASAAAESLRQQAGELLTTVGAFKLVASTGSAPQRAALSQAGRQIAPSSRPSLPRTPKRTVALASTRGEVA